MLRNKFLWGASIAWGLLTFLVVWVLLTPNNPMTKLFRAPVKQVSERIFTGPYPSASDFTMLKSKGVTSDISLLDPKIPYEKVLLHREQKNAEKNGIRFYDFPIASVLGQRFGSYYDAHVHDAAMTIDSLQKDAAGDKVYLHCYLGDHRMVAVRNALGIDTTKKDTGLRTASIAK